MQSEKLFDLFKTLVLSLEFFELLIFILKVKENSLWLQPHAFVPMP